MIGKTKEGWSVIADDHSEWSHSDLIRLHKRIDIDLAGMRSQDFIRPYLLPGTAVIDIGAHLGAFTIPMMRAVGPEGLVLAFEPDPELYLCLGRNIDKEEAENPDSSRHVLHMSWAVAEHAGTGQFLPNLGNRGAGHLNYGEKPVGISRAVNVTTLNELMLLLEGRPLSFIKIDCEGSEIDVIRGGALALAHFRPVLFIELNPDAFSARGISQGLLEAELAAFGYRFEYFPKEWTDRGQAPHDLLALPL